MYLDIIEIYGIIMWNALMGSCTCSIIRAMQKIRKKLYLNNINYLFIEWLYVQ